MGKSIDPIRLVPEMRDAELLNSTLRPIVSMSFQLAIPWRVALPQSPPPLHQPGAIMHERTAAGHQKSANGQLCLYYLSHPRGQAHNTRHLAAPRTFFAPWRVVLFWASLNASSTLSSPRRRKGRSAPAPLQGLPWRVFLPRVPLRSTHGLRSCAASRLNGSGLEARRP